MENKENDNNELNDSFFQEEGEYIINQKPKYKYEIKIIHDSSLDKPKIKSRKSKTPDKIISSSKFNIINKPKNIITKQNTNIIGTNYKSNNSIYNNTNYIDEHYDNFNNCSNYNFYNIKSSKNDKIAKISKSFKEALIPQAGTQFNIFSKTSDNFYNNKNCKKNNIKNFLNINDENIEHNKQCVCQEEFNQIIQKYFIRGKKIKNNNYNINAVKIRKGNNINKSENNNCVGIKKQFKVPLKMEKSIENEYKSKRQEKTSYNDKRNYNNMYTESSNSKRYNQNVYNKNNIFIKNNNRNLNTNNYLYIKNKKKITPDKILQKNNNNNKKPSNYSFISIDDSKNKKSFDDAINSKNNKSKNKSNDDNSFSKNSKNNNIMIHKSSERKENIKTIPEGQKIEPLIVKKTVQKPIIEKIKKEDGTIVNVMRQTTVVTSIETKPIINSKNKNTNKNNEKLVKEYITNIYTTLSKNIDENNEKENGNDKNLIRNKSYDDFNNNKKVDNNKNNEVFIKRKIADKHKKQINLVQSQNAINDDYNQKEIYNHKNNNISNDTKKNFNIDISEISNDLLKHKNNNSSMNYSSLISYEQIEPNNAIRINEEIKFVKYLYYRCTNLNSTNQAKIQSLSNYFLKLSDEEKIAILTNLNDGEPENKKIYKKLINILNEKRLENENSLNKIENNFGDNFISDFEDEEKKKKNKTSNLLFKKKKVVK